MNGKPGSALRRVLLIGSVMAAVLAGPASAQVSQYTGAGAAGAATPTTLTGDVTGTGTGTVATTISALPLSKLATISSNTVLGNNTGLSATPIGLTTAQTKSLLAIANTDVSGLGTASTVNTGTSGGTIPLLNGTNTFSGVNTFSAVPQVTAGRAAITSAGAANIDLRDTTNGGGSVRFRDTGDTSTVGILSAGSGGTVTVGGSGFRFTDAAITTVFFNASSSAFNLSTGVALQNNSVPIINGSGVLQAAGFPALTGDATTSAGSLATTIAANAVTFAKMQALSAGGKLLGSAVGSTAVAEITVGTGLTIGTSTLRFANISATTLLGNPTGGATTPSEVTLAGGLAFSGTTLTAAGPLTPTSVASTGSVLSSGATSGVGYATGAGGAVTQITSRTTGVTNNKACGAITMVSAAGSATWATFTVTDSAVAATDTIIANEKSGTNLYMLAVTSIGSGTFNLSFATTGGTATDAPVINYCVVKGVAA